MTLKHDPSDPAHRWNTVEEPVTHQEDSPSRMGSTRTTHPAFAQISASRVSGNSQLYDSDFKHQHYMTISIHRSELMRDLSRDWHFGREEIIKVAMSEAQWATFISTPNTTGTPCTLERRWDNGELQPVPGLPPPVKRSHQFKGEVVKTMQSSLGEMDKLDALIRGSGLSEKKQAALLSCARIAHMGITNSLGFVADQFDEHMEGTVEKAKIEISSYATAAIHRAGLEAIAGRLPVLTLSVRDDAPALPEKLADVPLYSPADSEGGEA